jgi:integrase/recombinase XerD
MARKGIRVRGVNIVTIGDAFVEFINDKAVEGVVQKTLDNYVKSYHYFLELEFDGDDTIEINSVTKIYVQQWIESLLEQGKRITTLNTYLRDVRVFLYWCMDDERKYIEIPYKISLVKGQEPLPKCFTDEEVAKLLQKPTNVEDFVEWRTWLMVNWVLATGNRAATITEVRLEDLDFTNGRIALRHTKNKKAQIIDMAESFVPILRNYIRAYRFGEPSSSYLFADYTTNDKVSYNALRQAFYKYCKARGVEKTNIHGLRHYFATRWIRNGGSGDKLQKVLGHSTYTMTQRYITLESEDVAQDFDRFNPLNNLNTGKTKRKRVSYNGD